LQVAIIGAGPAGLFAAHMLSSRGIGVAIINRDIKPGGLAEFGIFPDKLKMKTGLRTQFKQILALNNVAYYGNVLIGVNSCISVNDLLNWGFSAVLVACGAQGTKVLNLPGETLKGVYHAKDLVYHYNQLPPFSTMPFPVGKKVAVVGVGNVMTDIVHYLIDYCNVEEVTVVARRGPGEVKFEKKELLPIIGYLNLDDFEKEIIRVSPQLLAIGQDPEEAKHHILLALEKACPRERRSELIMRFLYSPKQVLGNPSGLVSGIELEQNSLVIKDEKVVAMGRGIFDNIDVDNVIFAIGDRVTFDLELPMNNEEILKSSKPKYPIEGITYEVGNPATGESLDGLFVAGWSRNASTGLVGIAHKDGGNAALSISQYLSSNLIDRKISEGEMRKRLDQTDCKYIEKEDLVRLEEAEKLMAQKLGQEDFKFMTNEEMFAAMGKIEN
jgi:ferredoxin--NADP+ reductase